MTDTRSREVRLLRARNSAPILLFVLAIALGSLVASITHGDTSDSATPPHIADTVFAAIERDGLDSVAAELSNERATKWLANALDMRNRWLAVAKSRNEEVKASDTVRPVVMVDGRHVEWAGGDDSSAIIADGAENRRRAWRDLGYSALGTIAKALPPTPESVSTGVHALLVANGEWSEASEWSAVTGRSSFEEFEKSEREAWERAAREFAARRGWARLQAGQPTREHTVSFLEEYAGTDAVARSFAAIEAWFRERYAAPMSLQRDAGLSTDRGTVVRIGGFVRERSIADWSIDPRAIVDLETIHLPGNARSDVEIVGLEARLPFESIRADFAIEFTVADWPRAISWGIGSDQLLFAPRDGWVWFGPAPLEPARRGQPRRYAELLDYNAVAGRPDRTAADPALHGVEALRVTVTDGVLTLRAVARDREVTIFEQRVTRFAIPRAPRLEVQGGDLKLRRVVFDGMPSAAEVRTLAFENREWTRVGSAIDDGDIDAALFPHAEVESHGNGAVTLTYDFSDGAPPSWRVKPRAGTRPTPMGVTTIIPGGVRFEFRPTFAALAEGTLVLRRFGTNPFEVLAQFPGRGVHSALRTRYLESAPEERATGGYLDDTSGSAPPVAAGQRLELTHERVEGDASRVRWLRNKRVLATLSVAPTPRPSAVEWELRGARARVEEVRLHGVVQDGWRFDRTREIRVRGAWERAMRTGEEFTPSWESFLRHGGEAKEVDGGWRLLPPESLRPHGNATALAFELWPDVWDRWRRASISTDIRLGAEKLWHAGFAIGFEGIGRPYLFVGANGNREVHAAVVEGLPPERVLTKERARVRSGQTWRLEIVARKGVLTVGRRTRLEFDIPPEIPIDAPIAMIARAGGAPIQVTPPVIAPVLAE